MFDSFNLVKEKRKHKLFWEFLGHFMSLNKKTFFSLNLDFISFLFLVNVICIKISIKFLQSVFYKIQ